jgi:hypothetical protein
MATPKSIDMRQAVCVAQLIGHCEAIARSGLLPEPSEESLRVLIAEVLSAFRMSPHQREITALEELRA